MVVHHGHGLGTQECDHLPIATCGRGRTIHSDHTIEIILACAGNVSSVEPIQQHALVYHMRMRASALVLVR